MNYQAHYDRLIARAKKRRIFRGYREKHHVVPTCMGGGNEKENIVKLTPEEHFVAHQLLVKIYPGHSGLIFAAFWMSNMGKNNKKYGWLKKRFVGQKKGVKFTAERCAAISAALKGRSLSPSHKANISVSGKGLRRSQKTCANIRATWDDPEVYLARCAASSEVQCRPEVRAKKSRAMRGQKRDQEAISNMCEAQSRPEVRLKKSLSLRGRKPSAATLAGIQRAKVERQSQHGGLFA